jgi:hypothetical protein
MEEYEKVLEKFYPYKDIPTDYNLVESGFLVNPKMGDWILLQRIEKDKMQYPMLALYIETQLWDMAIVPHFVRKKRTFEVNTCFINENGYSVDLYEVEPSVEKHVLWSESDIYIIGHWKHEPKYKELLEAYRKCPWYWVPKYIQRNRKINQLIS